MLLKDVYSYIDSFAPFSSQCDFDNAGFLIGDENAELKGGIVALDITEGVIDFAERVGANLIVTHHPVIFNPIKQIKSDNLIYRLIKSGISVISAHTNLDMAEGGINDKLSEILGLQNIKGAIPEGEVYSIRVGELSEPLEADELGALIKETLNPASIRYVGSKKSISRIAVCSGSGGSFLNEVKALGADAFITADVKHGVFLSAATLGIALYDCCHFDTEDIIVAPLTKKLNERFGNIFREYHSDLIKTVGEVL